MKIALIGYGKMGKVIESIAGERGHEIVVRFNSENKPNVSALENADLAIEFTRPELAVGHLEICLQAKCPVVIGTTGWYDHFQHVRSMLEEKGGKILHGTNFSIGVNITFYLNSILAKIINRYPEYNAEILEIHHTKKLDMPSGTAITLANGIINNSDRYHRWSLNDKDIHHSELNIIAKREGEVPGTHVVTYKSDIDTITLGHEAHNRNGFALGSVLAAEWLLEQKNGIYSIQDMLNFDALI